MSEPTAPNEPSSERAARGPAGEHFAAFDICGGGSNVALFAGRHCVAQASAPEPRSVADWLPAGLASLLAQQGWKCADLAWFATTTGPGSYTGQRGLLALIKGLALASGLPVMAFSAFAAIAQLGRARAGDLLVVDAGRGRLWVQPCAGAIVGPHGSHGLADGDILPLSESLAAGPQPVRILGSMDVLQATDIASLEPGIARIAVDFDAVAVGRAALELSRAGMAMTRGDRVLPLYLAAAEAQLRRSRSLIEPGH